MRVLLFTDTLGDVNGVSRFVRDMAACARGGGRALAVATSTRIDVPDERNIVNVPPMAATRMPGYADLELAVPPMGMARRLIERERPHVVHVSTPGPVGFAGFRAARRSGVPIAGVYHTDFPAYIAHLFDDACVTWLCTRAMSALYRRFTAVFTRSDEYAASLRALGVGDDRIVRLRPGIRVGTFHPRHRDPGVWRDHGGGADGNGSGGAGEPVRVLYVGRVSVEKNMPLLVRAWRDADARLRARGVASELVVVGDGPYRATMERGLTGTRARFLGFREGPELSRLYASSDLFVFPSMTDTLGQVVMEAQASGLAVLVSDRGGPKEVVDAGRTGEVLPGDRPEAWGGRIAELAADRARLMEMGRAARAWIEHYSIEASFEHWWGVLERVRGKESPREKVAE